MWKPDLGRPTCKLASWHWKNPFSRGCGTASLTSCWLLVGTILSS